MIQFLLNRQIQIIEKIAPSQSVLEYLRIVLGRTGTKEGCAAGDCGACTVVIAELKDEQLHYKAVNACITPMASLHGKQLITVEDLSEQNTLHSHQLHPVQKSMVDCHGSQCGFCTPGVVMSLFSWWQSVNTGKIKATRETIEHALSGNLCRCTGYQPILNAAWESLETTTDSFQTQEAQTIKQLKQIAAQTDDEKDESDFLSPDSIEQLLQYRTEYPDAQLVAGATDLGLSFTQQLQTPQTLIYTGKVAQMKRIEKTDNSVLIGAAVTYSEMHDTINLHYPAFAHILYRLGSLQVRNQGTLGGNIANASPIGDTPPVVLALDGLIHLQSVDGNRVVNANGFFTAYRQTLMQKNECIVAIELPLLKENEVLKVYEISKRFDDDISAVCLALWIKYDNSKKDSADNTIKDIRIACGGMAATPARAKHTEQVFIGQSFNDTSITLAQDALHKDFTPIDDVRASAAYRLAVVAKLLKRARYELENESDNSMNTQAPSKTVVNLFDPQAGDVYV